MPTLTQENNCYPQTVKVLLFNIHLVTKVN